MGFADCQMVTRYSINIALKITDVKTLLAFQNNNHCFKRLLLLLLFLFGCFFVCFQSQL